MMALLNDDSLSDRFGLNICNLIQVYLVGGMGESGTIGVSFVIKKSNKIIL